MMAYFHDDDGNDYNHPVLISSSPKLTYTLLGVLLRETPTSITSWHDIAAVYRLHLLQDPQASSLLAVPPNASRYPRQARHWPQSRTTNIIVRYHHFTRKTESPIFERRQHLNSIYTLD